MPRKTPRIKTIKGWRSTKKKSYYVNCPALPSLEMPVFEAGHHKQDSPLAPLCSVSHSQLRLARTTSEPGLFHPACWGAASGNSACYHLGRGYSTVRRAWGTRWIVYHLALLTSHRITGWLRLEVTSGGHLVQPTAQVGPPTTNCPGPHPNGF